MTSLSPKIEPSPLGYLDTRLADLQRTFSAACRRLDAIEEEEDASEERELTEGEMQARSDYYWPKGGGA